MPAPVLTLTPAPCCDTPFTMQIAGYDMKAWYSSPFPEEFRKVSTLHMCEFCLAFYKTKEQYRQHAEKPQPPEGQSPLLVSGAVCRACAAASWALAHPRRTFRCGSGPRLHCGQGVVGADALGAPAAAPLQVEAVRATLQVQTCSGFCVRLQGSCHTETLGSSARAGGGEGAFAPCACRLPAAVT